jgi:hypothetical protein
MRTGIKFLYKAKQSLYAVEKEDRGGRKRRYLYGVTSGTETDEEGERMTSQAIASMQKQFETGNILLYAGKHNQLFVDDVGIATNHIVTENKELEAEYRLWDVFDGFPEGDPALARADHLWKQANGLPPYEKGGPKKAGFSIEGWIPENGIRSITNGKRVVDDVILTGVNCVLNPAYPTSIAYAIEKALGEIETGEEVTPPEIKLLRPSLAEMLGEAKRQSQERDNYHSKHWELEETFMRGVEGKWGVIKIMQMEDGMTRQELLKDWIDQYANQLYELFQNSASYFQNLEETNVIKSETSISKGIENLMEQISMIGGNKWAFSNVK